MKRTFFWNGRPIEFRDGDNVAFALHRAGVANLGLSSSALPGRLFCGVGACQNCVVIIDGRRLVESCLTVPVEGMQVSSLDQDGRFNGTKEGNS